MGEIDLLQHYPRSARPIDERARLITEEHHRVARRFGREFFDGDRLTGYGGYQYHPRFWTDTVRFIRDHYRLPPDASILDVGSAKGFMLHDFHELEPRLRLAGIDVSSYATTHCIDSMRGNLAIATADALPFADDSFDLVISINSIHNLPLDRCRTSLREIERVSRRHSFVTMDAWHNEAQRERMLAWNLTALTYMHVDEWQALFAEVGYTGDFHWFIAE